MQFLHALVIDTAPDFPFRTSAALMYSLKIRGIRTAADVECDDVDAVPGFGDVRTDEVLAWRQIQEQNFDALPPAQKQQYAAYAKSPNSPLRTEVSKLATEQQNLRIQVLTQMQMWQQKLRASALAFHQAFQQLTRWQYAAKVGAKQPAAVPIPTNMLCCFFTQ